MRLLTWAIAVAAIGCGPAEAETVVWEQGGWTVAITQSVDGKAIGCHGYTTNDAGTRLVLSLYRSGEWRGLLGEHKGQPDFVPGPIQIHVDGKIAHEGATERLSATGGIRLGTLHPRVIDRFVQGYAMEVSTPQILRRPMSLSGSENALATVEKCVSGLFEIEQRSQIGTGASYRVLNSVTDGVLNLRSEPRRTANLITALPSGTADILPLGECRPSPDRETSNTWCHFRVGEVRGWAVMRWLALVPATAPTSAASQRPTASIAQPTAPATSQRPPVSTSGPSPAQRRASAFLSRDILLPVVSAFMRDAGISNYKIVPPKEDRDLSEVTWAMEDGTVSTLLAIEPSAKLSLQDVANTSIQRAAQGCEGEFASLRGRPRFFEGSEVQKVETRCLSGGGQRAVLSSSIVELPTGIILRFLHWNVEEREAEADQRRSNRAERIENAAIQVRWPGQ